VAALRQWWDNDQNQGTS